MTYTQRFYVIETDGKFRVYRIRDFPNGTIIGPEARRLRVFGESPVDPPQHPLTGPELYQWCRQLEASGRSVTLGPVWTDLGMRERSLKEAERGESIPLKEAFDEIRRRTEERDRSRNRRLESVEPPAT
jgi:hypothetical protein